MWYLLCWYVPAPGFCLVDLQRYLLFVSIFVHQGLYLEHCRSLGQMGSFAARLVFFFSGSWGFCWWFWYCQWKYIGLSASIFVRWEPFTGGSTVSVLYRFTGKKKGAALVWHAKKHVRWIFPRRRSQFLRNAYAAGSVLRPARRSVYILRNDVIFMRPGSKYLLIPSSFLF